MKQFAVFGSLYQGQPKVRPRVSHHHHLENQGQPYRKKTMVRPWSAMVIHGSTIVAAWLTMVEGRLEPW